MCVHQATAFPTSFPALTVLFIFICGFLFSSAGFLDYVFVEPVGWFLQSVEQGEECSLSNVGRSPRSNVGLDREAGRLGRWFCFGVVVVFVILHVYKLSSHE